MLNLIDVRKQKIRLFNNIGIEIASRCNRHCYFCPNGYFDRADVFMSEQLIFKILNELQELNYTGRIEWYIYNEPTRDKRLLEFIRICREILPKAVQMINTNGDYFKTKEDIDKYFQAGLNQMQINIYSAQDSNENKKIFLKGIELAKKRHKALQDMLDDLPHIDQKKLSLYQLISPNKMTARIIPKYGIQRVVKNTDVDGPNHFSNRSGNIPGFRNELTEPLTKGCTRPFRFLNINFNGDAILCCNDYYGQTNFGNVKTHSLEEIWNDVNFHIYRLKLQNKKRDCFLCDKCDFNGGYYPHMTDNVTFGKESDEFILNQNLSKREDIFGKTKISLPIEQQGTPKQFF